jgi:hypothetical protein
MIPYLLAALGGYLIGESQKKETEKSDAPQMAKGGETGAASMKIKLKDGVISVYHSDGSKLLSWKAKKGDWDKIWDKFNYLGHQTLATGGELGAAEIKVQLKNGNITIFHSDGRKLYGWKANSGDWDEIWDRLYELSGSKMEDGGMMAKGGLTDEILLQYHKTSGGAEYLLSNPIKTLKQKNLLEQSARFGDAKYIVRIDGAKKYGGELYIKDENDRKEIKLYYHKTSGGAEYLMSTPVEGTNEGSFDSEYIVRIDGAKNNGGELIISKIKMPMIYADGGMMAKGGKLDNEDELTWHGLKLTTKGSKAFVSGKPNPDYFGDENKFTDGGGYGGWWKSPNNFSIKKFEDLVKSKIPTNGVKFDSESSMFYAEGTRERMRKFFIDLMDSATMQYPLEFPFQTQKEYFNWESKRYRKAKNDIKEGRDKQAIDDFYFEMFSNYGEKSVKDELKKLFRKIDMAEMGDSDSKYHISKEKAVNMIAEVFVGVEKFNPEVHDTEPENNIIFFAEEKLKKKGYPRRYYEDLKQDVQENLRELERNYKMEDGGMMAEEVLDMKIKKYEEAYKNPNLTTGAKKSIRMKLNELKAYRKGTHNELSKYGKMEDGGMTDYYEDLRVYVQIIHTQKWLWLMKNMVMKLNGQTHQALMITMIKNEEIFFY